MNPKDLYKNKDFVRNFIFSSILFIFIIFVWIWLINLYINSHLYYFDKWAIRWPAILTNANNWILFLRWILISLIPISYLLINKNHKIWTFVSFLFLSVLIFGFVHTSYKWWLIWDNSWFVFFINTVIIFSLGIYFLVWCLSFWNFISEKIIKSNQYWFSNMFFDLWLGISVLMLFINFLIITQLFYWPIVWLVFILFGVCIYYQKSKLQKYSELIEKNIFSDFFYQNISKKPYLTFWVVLLSFSILYYLFGFQMSWIPYSTARDANHAYMYIPKVFAENNWTRFWWPWWLSPMLWYSYIAFWFWLLEPIKNWRLWPNTIPVAMNFLSGILVLIFWIGLVGQFLKLINSIKNINNKKKDNTELYDEEFSEKNTILIYVSWFLFILWLSSGMWAFLVFVDNKTDLGVMSMTLLAILSWFIFLEQIINNKEEQKQKMSSDWRLFDNLKNNIVIKYVIISALFFVIAIMSKITAFQDFLVFWLILIWFWFWSLFVVWISIFVIWFLSNIVILASSLFIPKSQSNPYMMVWIFWFLLSFFEWILRVFYKKENKISEKNNILSKNIFFQNQIFYFKYLLIRWFSFVLFLIILKWPQVLYSQLVWDTFSLVNFFKGLLIW